MAEEVKGGFNLDTLTRPIGQINLTVGTVFVHQANETGCTMFRIMTSNAP